MNNINIQVTARLEWHPEDADGSACACCGDAIYLINQYRAVSFITIRNNPQEERVETVIVVCGACHEAHCK